jgi:hypothetical protein
VSFGEFRKDLFMTEDLQSHLRKIRSDAAECLVLSSVSNDGKGQMFLRTAEHLNGLASELEKSIATIEATRAGSGEQARPTSVASEFSAPSQTTKYRLVIPWLLVVVFGVMSSALIFANGPVQKWWPPIQAEHEAASTSAQHESTSPPPDNSSQTMMLVLFSSEQAERKILSEQVAALAARLDGFSRNLDDLKKAHAEAIEPTHTESVIASTKPPATDTSPAPAVEKPVATAENILESSSSTKQSEPIGPRGCTLFRSFDPRSGTYVTLDGRRRQCR